MRGTNAPLCGLYQQNRLGDFKAGAELFEVIEPMNAKLEAWHYKEAATTWMRAKDKDKALAAARLSENVNFRETLRTTHTLLASGAWRSLPRGGEPKAAFPHFEKAITNTKLAVYIKDCQAKLAQAEEAAKK